MLSKRKSHKRKLDICSTLTSFDRKKNFKRHKKNHKPNDKIESELELHLPEIIGNQSNKLKLDYVTITFSNMNNTMNSISLKKYRVSAISPSAMLTNKGQLTLKTSEPIQSDLQFEFSHTQNQNQNQNHTPTHTHTHTQSNTIGIRLIKDDIDLNSIHKRNTFRIGTTLFFCADERRFFWAYPLSNSRTVSCQHFCLASQPSTIITRAVGIISKKCNKQHSISIPCVTAVCNAKPPKGIINECSLKQYQYFEHSQTNNFIKSVEQVQVQVAENENKNNNNETCSNNNNSNSNSTPKIKQTRKRICKQKEEHFLPFQQNVYMDVSALLLLKRNRKLGEDQIHQNQSQSEFVLDAQFHSKFSECQQMMLDGGQFDKLIEIAQFEIMMNCHANNPFRLLLAFAYFSRDYVTQSLQEINVLLKQNHKHKHKHIQNNNSNTNTIYDIIIYEAHKLRALILQKTRDFKSACIDFQFCALNNPYRNPAQDYLFLNEFYDTIYHQNTNTNTQQLPIVFIPSKVNANTNTNTNTNDNANANSHLIVESESNKSVETEMEILNEANHQTFDSQSELVQVQKLQHSQSTKSTTPELMERIRSDGQQLIRDTSNL